METGPPGGFVRFTARLVRDDVAAALILAAGCAGALLLYFVPPVDSGIYPPCPFHWLTGLHCPGCGTLRGLHHLFHGRIGQAASHNVLAVTALPFVSWVLMRQALGRPGRIPVPVWAGWAVLVIVMVFWVARNIPVYPLTLLAPP